MNSLEKELLNTKIEEKGIEELEKVVCDDCYLKKEIGKVGISGFRYLEICDECLRLKEVFSIIEIITI